jgi:hypothetical protein
MAQILLRVNAETAQLDLVHELQLPPEQEAPTAMTYDDRVGSASCFRLEGLLAN